jgi:drug/metabolite transporter (DMT)-like permease
LKAEPPETRSIRTGYISGLLAAALFGSVFTVAKTILNSVDPLVLSALVYTISGIALIAFAKASFRLGNRRDYAQILVVTGLGAIAGPVLLLYGLRLTSSADASILSNGEMVFTLILSALFFGERPKGKLGLLGVTIVIAGLFIATTDFTSVKSSILHFNLGNILILSAMLMWGIDNNVSRRLTLSKDATPAKIAMIKSLLGGVALLAISLLVGKASAFASIDFSNWFTIVAMSVSGFGGALLLFLNAMKRIGTVKTMTAFSMTPVFGLIIADVVGSELITPIQVLATAMIIIGIFFASRR